VVALVNETRAGAPQKTIHATECARAVKQEKRQVWREPGAGIDPARLIVEAAKEVSQPDN
jgi:hypothetical protein